jgi:dTDP-glucose 4,6-dehydratase
MDEKHPVIAQSPYAATKIAADQVALSYHLSFATPVSVVRPFNAYGPRQSTRAIIPTVISQILSGQRQLNLGNVSPTRDLTFVRDTIEGFLSIADTSSLIGEITNVSNGKEISICHLVELIAELMGVAIDIKQDELRTRPQRSEVTRLLGDNSKISAATGWSPKTDLRSGLLKTISWLKDRPDAYCSTSYGV